MNQADTIRWYIKKLAKGIREPHALCFLLMQLNVVKLRVVTTAEIDEFHERWQIRQRLYGDGWTNGT